MNCEEGENPREEEAVDRAKWLLGIWSGSSSGVGAGGDVFAALRGFDIRVLKKYGHVIWNSNSLMFQNLLSVALE